MCFAHVTHAYGSYGNNGHVMYIPPYVDDMYATGTRGDNQFRNVLNLELKNSFGTITC